MNKKINNKSTISLIDHSVIVVKDVFKSVEYPTIKKWFILIVILSFPFQGCSSSSNYKSEIIQSIPEAWSVKVEEVETYTGNWWESFGDTTFTRYYDDFQSNSPDLKSIISQSAMAKNSAKIIASSSFPNLNISASNSNRKQNLSAFGFSSSMLGLGDENNDPNENQDSNNNAQNSVVSFTSENSGLNVGMQWEVDIWGKLLNARRAAYKDYESTLNDLVYLKFSIGVQYVKAYYLAVESNVQYLLSIEMREALDRIKNIVLSRYDTGLSSSLDLRLAESSLAISRVQEENRLIQKSNAVRNLEILMGKYPSASLIVSETFPEEYPKIPAELPVNLIERRPDIQAAINDVEASGYRLAQSKRELLPAISLTTSAGTSSQDLKDILNGDYSIWNLATNVTAPLFQGGRLRANVAMNKDQVSLAKINAMKKLLQAFSEVEQSLANENSIERQYIAVLEAEEQSEAAYNLAVGRYEKGISDLITVLNSQQQLFTAKSQKYSLQNQRIRARVNLFLALGGDFYVSKN